MDEEKNIGLTFLNRLYKDLHLSEEVMHTAVPSDSKDEKVAKYLERLEHVEELAKNSSHNGMERLKELYYKKYVIKEENIPESYFELQKRIAKERGMGDVNITASERKSMCDTIIKEQKESLNSWLDYLMSEDAMYPEWFKYYAFQGMLKLGAYNKESGSFSKRTSSTTNIFVDLNREALALIYDQLTNVLKGNKVTDEELQQLLENGSFSKLYAYQIKKLDEVNKNIDSNEGIWRKFERGSNAEDLVKTLEDKGTGWCTAGLQTAKEQLDLGDFYVYYTKTKSGNYNQPRIAIRMVGNEIAEIRGIAKQQNLEAEMESVLDKKLEEFPDKDKYKKKVSDMAKMTEIYKANEERELTIEELKFLYEIDEEIQGFGYDKDPRIKEIISRRYYKEDLSKLFGCNKEEISNDKADVINGKKIVCFYGDLDLSDLKKAEGMVLPKIIRGSLNLKSLTSAEGLTLPNTIEGNLDLRSLTSAESLTLPNIIGGGLYLNSLTSAENLTLPKKIGGKLDLRSLTSAENLTLPNTIGGSLYLDSLTSTEGLTLPNTIGKSLSLNSLTSTEGLILPNTMGGSLDLSSLINAESLTLPNIIGGGLYLNSLTSVKGLILPSKIGSLDLRSLTSTEGLILPNTMEGSLDLSSLINAEDLTLPNTMGGSLDLSSLINAESLTLPNTIGGNLYLDSLTSLNGLDMPENFILKGYFGSNHFSRSDLFKLISEKENLNLNSRKYKKQQYIISIKHSLLCISLYEISL